MKEYFVNNSINLIKSKYNYDNNMIDRVKYGLEIIYITVSKTSVIFIFALLFGKIKETAIFTLLILGIKPFVYGLHAKKSWQCYIMSLVVFIFIPIWFCTLDFNLLQKIIIGQLSLVSLILFAPADTYKRPIINKKHRKKLKFISCGICTLYLLLSIILKGTYTNIILSVLVTIDFSINPIIYKILKLPYNNYKKYL